MASFSSLGQEHLHWPGFATGLFCFLSALERCWYLSSENKKSDRKLSEFEFHIFMPNEGLLFRFDFAKILQITIKPIHLVPKRAENHDPQQLVQNCIVPLCICFQEANVVVTRDGEQSVVERWRIKIEIYLNGGLLKLRKAYRRADVPKRFTGGQKYWKWICLEFWNC